MGDAVRSPHDRTFPLIPSPRVPLDDVTGPAPAPIPASGRHRVPGPLRRAAAVALAAGGAASVLGAAAPLAGPVDLGGTLDPTTGTATQAAFVLPAPGEPVPANPAAPAVRTTPVGLSTLADAATTAREQATASVERQRAADEEARRAEERAKAALAGRTLSSGSTSCGMSTASLGAVKQWVASAVEFLGCQFGRPQTLGVGSRGNASDHPSGLAADFLVDQADGDAIAACALRNMSELGVTYVIWQQQINFGSGWQDMEDRGSPTANHEDHVHISFETSAPSGRPTAC